MRSIRTLIAGGVVTALAVTALAMPVAAASKGKVAFVNGMPGTKIDICVGSSNEIRSGMKYGVVAKRQLLGTKQLKFRKATAGKCKGQLLASKRITLTGKSDVTVVVTKKSPKVLVFDNKTLGIQPAAVEYDGALALRHAADLPWNAVYFRRVLREVSYDDPLPPTTAALDPNAYEKGSERAGGTVVNDTYVVQIKVTRADPSIVLAKSSIFEIQALKRYEYILVGTNMGNLKLVRVMSGLASPPEAG